MKKIIKLIIPTLLFSSSVVAEEEYPYLKYAHDSGINNCDQILNENFSYFNNFENNKFQLYHESIKSLTNNINTMRYYFSYGENEELTFGDITVVETPTECQTFMQISMSFDEQSCSVVEKYKNSGWKFDEQHGISRWLVNEKGNYGLLRPINEFKGCMFNYYLTKASLIKR